MMHCLGARITHTVPRQQDREDALPQGTDYSWIIIIFYYLIPPTGDNATNHNDGYHYES